MMQKSKTKFKETEVGRIPKSWKILKFGDIAQLKKELYKPKIADNVAYIGLEHIDQENLSLKSVGNSDNLKSNKNRFQSGDILFGKLRPYFRKVYRPKFNGICSTDIWVIKAKEKIDQGWLYWFVANKNFVNFASSGGKGTKMPRADWDQLSVSEWAIPPIDEQKKIAEILGTLDEKIELNRKMNRTLESLAQTIFKKRFINNMSNSTEGKVGDVVDILDSKRIPLSSRQREQRQGAYPYYGATSIMGYIDDYIFDGTYLLIGEDGSVAKDNGKPYTQYVWGKIWVNNHAHVLKGKNGFSTELLKIFFDSIDIQPYITGAVQPKLNQENLKNIPINLPSSIVIRKINEAIEPIFAKIKNNTQQIETLSQMRDLLLPRLISGRLRVT